MNTTNYNKYENDAVELIELDSMHAEQFIRSFFALSDEGRNKAISRFNDVVGNCVSLGHNIHARH